MLGVYWHFDFPTGFYQFDYFRFIKGSGGHADAPVELTTTMAVADAVKIITRLQLLTEHYSEALLFIYREDNQLRIETGSYTLFDYDFLFAKKVEDILSEEGALVMAERSFVNSELIKLQPKETTYSGMKSVKNHFPTNNSGVIYFYVIDCCLQPL